MTTEQIDDRILKLKKEQLALSNSWEQMQERMNSARVRHIQCAGAINELEDLKKSLNGSEQP